MSKKIDTIPFNMMRRLAKAEIKACEHVSPAELARLRQQDIKRAKAAKQGRN